MSRHLAAHGAKVVVVDVDAPGGQALAEEVGGFFVHADVADPGASLAMVQAAVARFSALDLVHLNAGVTSGCGVADDFDLARYRRAMGVNLDGVVFGIHAALPHLRGRPGAQIVVTASMAGLVGLPGEPIYTANKHAVVGLVRALGPALKAEEGVRINALCPAFTDTPLVAPVRSAIAQLGLPIIPVAEVVDAFAAIVADDRSGECWFVQRGRPAGTFEFQRPPGPRPPA